MELIKWAAQDKYPGGITVRLTQDEAINLYEALLLAKRNKWTEGECDDIRVEIVEQSTTDELNK